MQNISREEIIHIAKLANLNLSEEEINKYRDNMQEILEFANTINEVNTEGLNETIGTFANPASFNAFLINPI